MAAVATDPGRKKVLVLMIVVFLILVAAMVGVFMLKPVQPATSEIGVIPQTVGNPQAGNSWINQLSAAIFSRFVDPKMAAENAYILIHVGDDVQAMLVSQNGLVVGTDGKNQFSDQQGSWYKDEKTSEGRLYHEIMIPSPVDGKYSLILRTTKTGQKDVALYATDDDGKRKDIRQLILVQQEKTKMLEFDYTKAHESFKADLIEK